MRWGLLAMRWLGALGALGALYMIGSSALLWARGERAEGVVVAAYDAPQTDAERKDLAARGVRPSQVGSLAEAVDVRFSTADGRQMTFSPRGGVARGSLEPGDEVVVLYDPGDPQAAHLATFRSLFLGPLLVGLLGSVFWAIGWLGKVLSDDDEGTTSEPRRASATVTAMALVVGMAVLGAAGCGSGHQTRPRSPGITCGAVAGVFANLGRNDRDPAKHGPKELQAFLLGHLATSEDLPPQLARATDVAVAIRHASNGVVRFAVLDPTGGIVYRGTSDPYDRCSRGVLERVRKIELKLEDGWLGSDETLTQTLFISSAGTLVLASESSAYGLFLGFPILGTDSNLYEFPRELRYDVRSLDF